MRRLRTFLNSPLARHPRLLVRKIAWRLKLYREDAPVPAPPVDALAHPAAWSPALQSWMSQMPLRAEPHPFHRVFGHDFDQGLLLRLCREGPRRGERGLSSDIKLIWDYSRAHPLFTNAALGPGHIDVGVAFIHCWLEANADMNGPAWVCAMDVAIRAVNWIMADVMSGGELGRRVGSRVWAQWLWRHGFVTWQRLEARIISSNHYLADLLGLIVIGSIFPDDARATAWLRFAQGEFPRALLAQTRDDGGLNEASLRYHAFVTEMALLARLAVGVPFPPVVEARLKAMCRIVADFRDATGDVFAMGDDDSGRVLAVDFASTMGRAEILLRLASTVLKEEFKTGDEAIHPRSGWWARRAGDFAVALDFGGVGLCGHGAHAHNDDLSLCLDWRGRPVVVDPGTFLYTSDPEARNRFRSTAAHNTLILDGCEQRELTREPFLLTGRDEALAASRLADGAWRFSRAVTTGVSHSREVRVGVDEVSIRDWVEGIGKHQAEWRFNLHPSVSARMTPNGFVLELAGNGSLLLEADGAALAFELASSEYSPAYGHSQPTQTCIARGQLALPAEITWKIRPVEQS